ncbi:hypothetical protein, partial [uncultured Methanoculleus sp.]|uniref:hypothetical protein n=1 Tax=uncultured Methanoculleus sp. TaxID=183762 RepID=UPI003204AFB8
MRLAAADGGAGRNGSLEPEREKTEGLRARSSRPEFGRWSGSRAEKAGEERLAAGQELEKPGGFRDAMLRRS